MTMTPSRPNVLWLMCDQLRYHALGCSGDPNLQGLTPNIDRIAAEGVRFTTAVSQYPICTPFRGSLVTARMNHRNGVRVHGDMLPTDQRCVGHVFADAGYRTSWVGKWHLASQISPMGYNAGSDYWVHPYLRGGFQDWFGFDCSNHFYETRYCKGDRIYPAEKLVGFQTDALTDLSLDYLEENAVKLNEQGTPWFHCLSVEAPHPGKFKDQSWGHPAPPEYIDQFADREIELRENVPLEWRDRATSQLREYYAQIVNLDDNVGRILDWLDESGQAENTLVVFFSDHGECAGSHGRTSKEYPIDESARIPLLMRLPGKLDAGQVVAAPISGVDLYPTCAGLAGVKPDDDIDGIDQSAWLLGEVSQPPREGAIIQWLGPALYGFADYHYRAIRTTRYLYAVGTRHGEHKPFNLLIDYETDPYGLDNLFGKLSHTELQTQLHELLKAELVRCQDDAADMPAGMI